MAPERIESVITLDLASLTLGEMSEAEVQSGKSMTTLLAAGRATKLLLALWVHERRTSAHPRSWHELASLPLSDAASSTSPSPSSGEASPASPSPRSND